MLYRFSGRKKTKRRGVFQEKDLHLIHFLFHEKDGKVFSMA